MQHRPAGRKGMGGGARGVATIKAVRALVGDKAAADLDAQLHHAEVEPRLTTTSFSGLGLQTRIRRRASRESIHQGRSSSSLLALQNGVMEASEFVQGDIGDKKPRRPWLMPTSGVP